MKSISRTALWCLSAAAALALLGGPTTAQAAPFTNGTFESPDLDAVEPDSATDIPGFVLSGSTQVGAPLSSSADFQSSTYITGWTATTTGVDYNAVYLADISTGFFPTPTSGDQVVAFNNDPSGGVSALSQTFDTVLGQPYIVGFDLARETGGASAFPSLRVQATGGLLVSYLTTDAFVAQTYAFVATGTSTVLTFSRLSAGEGRSPVLDTVTITAVPEPASLGLIGLAAVAMLRRRRMASSSC